jgi:hypothetical protein
MVLFAASVIAFVILLFKTDLNFLEFGGLVVALVVSFRTRRAPARKAAWQAETLLHRFARRRRIALLSVGALTVALRLAVLPIDPVPQPVVVDEFSHRLLAETLLLGRAANPTHPMWSHMETIQVIQKPTYASMYLPGQGLFLAMGKLLTGSLWGGVVIGVALMSMAICWALQGWLPPGWALLGGLIAALRFGLFSYWMNSYWGGALGALGGALVLGAWPRIRKRMSVGSALLMGAGMGLLIVTRPFEGAVVCVPVGIAALVWLARLKRFWQRRALMRFVAPLVCVLGSTGGLLAYYNSRVTGNPLKLAYAVNMETYGWPLTLPWFKVQPHSHSSKEMHEYFKWEADEHDKVTNPAGHIFITLRDAFMLWTFFAGPALTVFLLFLPRAMRDRRMRVPAAMLGAGLLAVVLEQSRYPHYLAPATAAYLVLLLQSARHMRAIGARKTPQLLTLARLVPVILLVAVAARATVPPLWHLDSAVGHYMSWCCGRPGNLDRAGVLARLEQMPGRHLVIVRYGPKHEYMYEWVYNEPAIDGAKVVWARDMGQAANAELVHYFAARHVWLLLVDDDRKPAMLMPYSSD